MAQQIKMPTAEGKFKWVCVCVCVCICILVQYLGRTEEGIRSLEAGVTSSCEPFSIGSGDWTQPFGRTAGSLNHWAIHPDPIPAHPVCSTWHSCIDILLFLTLMPTHCFLLFSGHIHFYFPDVYTYTVICAHKIMGWLAGSAPGLGDLSLIFEPTWWNSWVYKYVYMRLYTHTLCPHAYNTKKALLKNVRLERRLSSYEYLFFQSFRYPHWTSHNHL